MNFLIIGAGAIGCLVGAKLVQAKHSVTLVGRSSFVQTVRQGGLTVIDGKNTLTVAEIKACISQQEAIAAAQTPFDCAILCVKSYDTATAIAELQSACHSRKLSVPPVLSLQNGVGNEEIIAALGAEQVLAGNITTPVSIVEAGVVEVERPRYGIGLAVWDKTDLTTLTLSRRLQTALSEAGFAVAIYPSAEGMKWSKLLMNIVGNTTSTILDELPRQAFADPAILNIEVDAWREALAVMRAAHIPVLNMEKYPLRWLAIFVRWTPYWLLRPVLRGMVSGARGAKMPGIHIDLSQGKVHNEIDWLNGAVVRKGRQLGITTPINRSLSEIVMQLFAQPELRSQWRGDHARLLAAVRTAKGEATP